MTEINVVKLEFIFLGTRKLMMDHDYTLYLTIYLSTRANDY